MMRTEWGPWVLDIDLYVLRIEGVRKPMMDLPGADYEVDLELCLTSAEVLDLIMQIAGKTWGTDAVIAGLVRAIDDVLHPQANLCSMGMSKSLTRAEVKACVKGFAAPAEADPWGKL